MAIFIGAGCYWNGWRGFYGLARDRRGAAGDAFADTMARLAADGFSKFVTGIGRPVIDGRPDCLCSGREGQLVHGNDFCLGWLVDRKFWGAAGLSATREKNAAIVCCDVDGDGWLVTDWKLALICFNKNSQPDRGFAL